MTTPTITPYPGDLPAKEQSNPVLDANVDDFLTWLSDTNGPELVTFVTYAQDVADNVLATALAGDLPPLTGKAGQFIRANAAEDGGEFRTPAQVLAAIGAAPLANPALTGTPTAPTAAAGTSTTQVATTDFVTNEIEWTTTTIYDSVTDGDVNTVEITFVDGFEYMVFGDGLGLNEAGGLGFKVQMDAQPSNTNVFDVPFTSAGANENNFLLDLKLARVATSGRVLSCLIGNQADADSSGFTASSNGSIVVFSVTDTRANPDKIKKVFFYASGSGEFDLGLIKLMKRRINYV